MNGGTSFGAPTGDSTRFLQLLSAKWVAQALSAGAELGVYDALDERSRSGEELARDLGCQPQPLATLLRVLAGEELLEEDALGVFHLTDLGKKFRTVEQGELARFLGSPSQWNPWAHLAEAIRTGKNAYEIANGQTLFPYLRDHPQDAELYHVAVDAFTTAQAHALSQLDLFDDMKSVVDVGGGRGKLLLELLGRKSHLCGVLFDLPEVIDQNRAREIDSRGGRLTLQGGDFFVDLPAGHDAYLIKHVIHNWSDEQAIQLLRSAGQAMGAHGCIVLVDDLLIPGNRRDLARYMDLEMFVVTGGGRERSKPEFRRLISRSGLKLSATERLTQSTWAFVLKHKD